MAKAKSLSAQARSSDAAHAGQGKPGQPNGTACIYMRASGDQPRQELARQLRRCRHAVPKTSRGSFARQTFSDFGRAHAGAVRPGLGALLERARAGEIAVVVVECLSRLSRDLTQMERIFTDFERAGVKVITADLGPISKDNVVIRGFMAERYRL